MINLKNASILGFLFAVAALVALLYRKSLLGTGPISDTIQILAVLLMVWARITFGKRSYHAVANPTGGGLVTSGPYKFLRHPIYAAILYFVWAGISVHASLINCLLGLAVTIGLVIRLFAEERLVTQQYPEYVDYAKHAKRIIPFIL